MPPSKVIPLLPMIIPVDSLLNPVVSVHVFEPEFHVPIHWQSPPVASSVIVYGAPSSVGVVSEDVVVLMAGA